jgi:hypothetical protein
VVREHVSLSGIDDLVLLGRDELAPHFSLVSADQEHRVAADAERNLVRDMPDDPIPGIPGFELRKELSRWWGMGNRSHASYGDLVAGRAEDITFFGLIE